MCEDVSRRTDADLSVILTQFLFKIAIFKARSTK
jgi:hypothetical protein